MGLFDTGPPTFATAGQDYGRYTLWRTAPLLCNGSVALLGEPRKFISVSAQRISGLQVLCAAGSSSGSSMLRADLTGAPGESVTMVYATRAESAASAAAGSNTGDGMVAHRVSCTLGVGGKATLEVVAGRTGAPTGTCSKV